ncbi:MAG: hypothetical protein ACJ77M_06630, partial [Thermoleophilaceae bacterium]
MRVAVYCDYPYRRDAGGAVYAEQAFAVFLFGLARHFERLVLVGRLEPEPGRFPYRLPAGVDFAELPHYASLARPAEAMIGSLRALRSFWRVLGEVDAVWLLGPHPLAIVVAPLAALRGKRVALGVRQDLVSYARTRRPDRRDIQFLARALELMYRGLARVFSVVAIGSDLAARYGGARRVLDATVSLV